VDIYDALTSARPYKLAFAADRALAMIQEETDRGWRNPRVVGVFLRLHKDFLSKIAEDALPPDRSLNGMWTSLANLQRMLAAGGLPMTSS
jgi:HD-GYP domain-containing protein (c-di-GMP phosphodiesterase class II)